MARQRLSQSALARAMGTRQSTVRGWLNGRQPESSTLERLLERLNVAREALFDRPGHLGGDFTRQALADSPAMNAQKIKAVMPRGCKELLLVDYIVRDLEETRAHMLKLEARLEEKDPLPSGAMIDDISEYKIKPKPKK